MEVTFKIVYGHTIKVFDVTMVAKQWNLDFVSKWIKSSRECWVLLDQAKKCWLDTWLIFKPQKLDGLNNFSFKLVFTAKLKDENKKQQ